MNITLFACIALLLFAMNGCRLGIYRMVAALASFFLASLLAKPFSPVFVWLLLRSSLLPLALVPLSGLLLAGLFLFLLFDFCAGHVLRKREAARKQSERPPVARWERIGGAVLGTAWGAFLVVFVLIGVHLIGNVEEVMAPPPAPPVPAQRQEVAAVSPVQALSAEAPVQTPPVQTPRVQTPRVQTPPAQTPPVQKAQTPAKAPFVALKNQIEKSVLGGLVQITDPVGEPVKEIFRDLKTVSSDHDLYEAFTHHPAIERFTKDPRMLALSQDKHIQAQLQNRQYFELLNNPKIAALLTDDAFVKEISGIDIGKVLEEVIGKAPNP